MDIKKKIFAVAMMAMPMVGFAQSDSIGTVIDEVIWVIGDEAILKSDVEAMRMQAAMEGIKWSGDPDCTIPEQIAVQKLFKHQAQIDSIEVTDVDVAQDVEQQINYWLEMVDGSRERLEEYKHQPLSQIRNELREEMKDRQMVQRMKAKLVEDITVTPAEVRRYFLDLPSDSIPFVPTEVEVQIIQQTPRIEQEELNRVKEDLREYTERINKGESSFQTLARLYSEDPGTARRGGEAPHDRLRLRLGQIRLGQNLRSVDCGSRHRRLRQRGALLRREHAPRHREAQAALLLRPADHLPLPHQGGFDEIRLLHHRTLLHGGRALES